MKKILFCLILAIAAQLTLLAQNKILISGSVTDAANNAGLPYATVSLKKHLIGIVTNESGSFDLYVPEEMMDDTLLVGYFGYRPQMVKLKGLSSPVNIRLRENTVELKEVVVKPQPPEYYIKWAVLSMKKNYPNAPFVTEAYYREKVLENKNFIKCDEGIFKSYCPNYIDTLKNQHQLLLYREEKDIHEVQFMLKERQKEEEKERKRAEKENAKKRKKGQPETAKPKTGDNNNTGVSFAESFGGPENILRQADFTKHPEEFMDTTKFNDFKYTFAKSSTYNNKELMVIDFKSRGKVDHIRSKGRIYIDVATHAFVKIEYSGDFVIPVLLRPILFFAGFGIENPTFETMIEFQQVAARWYPKNIQYNVNINISKKHMFSANETSDFVIEGIYTVNKLSIDGVKPIPADKRFDSKKPLKGQVHNDDGITWDGINIIKR